MQDYTLSNGVCMPALGYGTFQITDTALCEQCVENALALPAQCGDNSENRPPGTDVGKPEYF